MAETEAANHQEINVSENKEGNYDTLFIFVLLENKGGVFGTLSEIFDGTFYLNSQRKLNVHKAFRRRVGCLLYVLCTFNIR